MDLLDLVEHRVVFLAARLVNRVVGIVADAQFVGGNGEDAQLVDVEKLLGLGGRSTGHAGQLGVEAEIVLDGDGGQRLGLLLDGDGLLGLDSLVQPVAPATARHGSAGVFVHDDDLVLLHHVGDIPHVKAVRLEQLAGDVDVFRLGLELVLQLGLGRQPALGIEPVVMVDIVLFNGEVRQHERIGIVRVEECAALLSEVGVVAFFLDAEVKLLFLGIKLLFGLVGVQGELALVDELLILRLLHEPKQALALRLAKPGLVEQQAKLQFQFGGVLGAIV